MPLYSTFLAGSWAVSIPNHGDVAERCHHTHTHTHTPTEHGAAWLQAPQWEIDMQGDQLEEDELQTEEAAQQVIERNAAVASFTATPTPQPSPSRDAPRPHLEMDAHADHSSSSSSLSPPPPPPSPASEATHPGGATFASAAKRRGASRKRTDAHGEHPAAKSAAHGDDSVVENRSVLCFGDTCRVST